MSDVRRGSAYQFRTVPESETCDDTFDIKYLPPSIPTTDNLNLWAHLELSNGIQPDIARFFFIYTKALGLERVRRASSYSICPFRSILIKFIVASTTGELNSTCQRVNKAQA